MMQFILLKCNLALIEPIHIQMIVLTKVSLIHFAILSVRYTPQPQPERFHLPLSRITKYIPTDNDAMILYQSDLITDTEQKAQ